jgi:hypothetical protein
MIIGLDLKKNALLFLLCIALSTVSVSADFRTIAVDGEVLDWGGVPPIVTDPPDDWTGSPEEDIKAVYASNENDNLYFWMELYNDVPIVEFFVQAEANFEGFEYAYIFFIDNIPGAGDPDYGGADYAIEYSITGVCNVLVNVTLDPDQIPMTNTFLLIWNGTGWESDYECLKLNGNAIGPNIEVSVDWDCIGGIGCFNTLFMAKSGIPNTDYAPDKNQDVPVTIMVCPCFPVAGELLPSSWGKPFTYYLLAAIILVSMITLTYSFMRSRKVRLFTGI